MGESESPLSNPTVADLPIISPVKGPSSPLVRAGGFLGIAGSLIGLLVLVVGCAGYGKALKLSPGSIGCGVLGILLTLLGAFTQRRKLGEDTHVLQALFACLLAIIGGLVELAVWKQWPMFK